MLVAKVKTSGTTKQKMKRYGNLYERIISIENLKLADDKARRGKSGNYGVRKHDKNRDENILKLHELLKCQQLQCSEYRVFTIYEPKERVIYQLPYYPDRIVHHAIMNVLEPIWCKIFIRNTFACIKGRGIHDAMNQAKRMLKDVEGTKYCLKIDVRKYYPSISHDVLKAVVRQKIKCTKTLKLLDEIIGSAPGVPIGNYLSQYFANLYLAYFDHWIKEELKVKYYLRYADDMVFMAADKAVLHGLLIQINHYFTEHLNVAIKSNFQIFPVESRGLDFVGFVFRHSHTRMRKSIKRNFARRLKLIEKKNLTDIEYKQQLCGWLGWAKHSDSRHFLKKNIKQQHYESILQSVTSPVGANARRAH
jgi:retron-type reverse transcriptase